MHALNVTDSRPVKGQKKFMSSGLPVLAVLAFLGACEGSSDKGAPAGNSTPVITSASAVTVPENTTDFVYTLTATDADGDALVLGIANTKDSSAFSFDATTGELTFISTPDFESPLDGDRDNVYEVSLTAKDPHFATGTVALTITVENVYEASRTRRISDQFTQPVFTTSIPGTDDMVVVERGGLVRVVDPATGAIESVPFLDLTADVDTAGEGGLLGLAFSPFFATSKQVFVNFMNTNSEMEIRSYTMVTGSTTQADATTANTVIKIPQPANTHNGGWIGFDAVGFMYVPTGDGGGSSDVAQDLDSLLGKILRIDITGDGFTDDDEKDYIIPATNPFASSGGAPEIWAVGVRNPFRNGYDAETNTLYIGDVGQNTAEEISRIKMDTASEADDPINFGWAVKEGTQDYQGTSTATLIPPVAEYLHSEGLGTSITGGYMYRGVVDDLRGKYVFGDFTSGKIFSILEADFDDDQTLTSSSFTDESTLFTPDAGTITNISSFGTDADGDLYVVDYGGSLFVIEKQP